ncbi:MAG: UDP-glucose/GDP-mannose dehydrogenase family protein [Armatimonadetes bacterium]|nr:UDP-glucose/GDP-mannose dehydrogenase family protein [Armatimonadota bacterium]
MKISIVGSGYVGLVTGACLAELGHEVLCVDNDTHKIEELRQGRSPIYEPGLEELVRVNARESRLSFSTSVQEATAHGTIVFICVGTPPGPDGEADLSFVEAVSREIALNMEEYRLVVEKSTVPVQTGQWVQRTIAHHVRSGVEFDVASNPEFLREGSAIRDFMHPDRVVIGTSSDRAASLLVKLYEPLNAPLLLTDINSAELIKHSANAFLALKICFINAVSRICEKSGADVVRVAKGIGLDRRIGVDFLQAGIGFGGSCFPKDVEAFIGISSKLGYDFKLLREVLAINQEQRQVVLTKLEASLGDLAGKRIGLLGLTFKPDTDDLRNAPSLDIVRLLVERDADVRAYDPKGMERARGAGEAMEVVHYCDDPYEVAENADALVVVTEWDVFRRLDLQRIHGAMRRPFVIDGRNIYDPARMRRLGFEYHGVGR